MSTDFSDGGGDLFPDLAEDYSDDPALWSGEADTGAGPEPVDGFDLDDDFGAVSLTAGTGHVPAWVQAHVPHENLADALTQRQQAGSPSRKRAVLWAAGAAAALVLGTLIGVSVLGGDREDTAELAAAASSAAPVTEASPEPEPAPDPADEFAAWCVPETTEYSLVSNGPGDQRTPVGVILAFQHAYYADRDAPRAASLMDPVRDTGQLQAGIDEVPRGTDHCVTVSTTDRPQVFEVTMHLRTPSDDEGMFTQRVVVVPAGGEYRIASIEAVTEGA